jgi:hypothetical protein
MKKVQTALATINSLPSNKEQVTTFSRNLKDEILANTVNALPVLVHLQLIKRALEDVLTDEEVDLHFLKEYQLYDKDEKVVINGAELRQQEVGVSYLYKDCGDPQWEDLNKKIKDLTDKRKDREKFLQNIPYDNGVVDPDTGLFITRAPKKSSTKVIVKL